MDAVINMINEKGVIVHPDEITERWEKTVLSSDINLFGIHPVGGQGSHNRVLDIALHGLPGSGNAVKDRLIKNGIAFEYEMHAMSMLLPRELFDTHPEYFRLDEDGNRNADYNCCSSNEDALEIISEKAAFIAKTLPPSDHRYNLWLDDVKDKCCHCKDCERFSSSDQAMRIYNAVLRGLRRVDPLATESYLAYVDTTVVPQKVAPDDGIFLEYAPFERNFHIPMENEVNASSANDAKRLIEFFGRGKAKALEYWLDNSLYSSWTKPPKKFVLDKEVAERDLEFYDRLGYTTVTTFACYLGSDYEELYGFPDLNGYIKYKE